MRRLRPPVEGRWTAWSQTGKVERVVVVDAYPHVWGGSQRIAGAVARAAGDASTVVLVGDGIAAKQLRAAGVRVEIVEAPDALRRYGESTQALRALFALPWLWWRLLPAFRRAQVVWADDLRGVLLVGLPARLLRRPIVWHLHDAVPRPGLATRIAEVFAAAIVVPQEHIARANQLQKPYLVIPNPVDIPTTCAKSAPAGSLLTIARIHPSKGLDTLVAVAAELRDRGVSAVWTVVGGRTDEESEYATRLDLSLRRLGLTDRVLLTGFDPEPAGHLQGCTVYVQPSRRESLPLAVLEAMAAARPVVTSDTGGLADLVRGCGVVVPVGDVDALATAIEGLFADPDTARELGLAGQRRAREHYGRAQFDKSVRAVLADVGRLR